MSARRTPIGWIGAGRMGHAMVLRLLDADQPVAVWNRTHAKTSDLSERGAVVVDSLAELSDREVVCSIVSGDLDLLEVMLGESGLLRQRAAPAIIVDSTTVSGETSERIRLAAAERGTAFLAAPVSGSVAAVKSGDLALAVSGAREAFDRVAPLLQLLGRSVTYVDEGDGARLVKLAHNILLGVVTQSLAEVVVLAERGGIARSTLMNFINTSVMGSMFSRYKTAALVGLDMSPAYTAELLLKDLDLGLAAGRASQVPLPLASLTRDLVQSAIGRGHGIDDIASLLIEEGRNAGLELQPEG